MRHSQPEPDEPQPQGAVVVSVVFSHHWPLACPSSRLQVVLPNYGRVNREHKQSFTLRILKAFRSIHKLQLDAKTNAPERPVVERISRVFRGCEPAERGWCS